MIQLEDSKVEVQYEIGRLKKKFGEKIFDLEKQVIEKKEKEKEDEINRLNQQIENQKNDKENEKRRCDEIIRKLEQQIHEKDQKTSDLIKEKEQKDQNIISLTKDKKQAEDKASASEVRCKALEQEKIQKDEKIKTMNQEKTQKDLKIDALTKEKSQSEQKAVQFEGRIKTLEQDRKQLEEKSTKAEKDKNEALRKMNEISKRMNDLLKSMVSESDLEKLRMIPWIEMCKDLSKPIGIVCEQEGSIELQRQIEICEYLNEMFKDDTKNDEYRKRCIKSGIAKALLNIFENWKVEDIKEQHSKTFAILTQTNNEIKQLLFTLNPFEGLLNLLNHSNSNIQFNGISSIFNVQLGGSETISDTETHPYFDSIASIGGIEKIYEFRNRKNTDKVDKKISAIIIGSFHRARKIENVEIRINVIKHLKTIVNNQNNSYQNNAIWALKYLAQNSENKKEIEKDGFAIPT